MISFPSETNEVVAPDCKRIKTFKMTVLRWQFLLSVAKRAILI